MTEGRKDILKRVGLALLSSLLFHLSFPGGPLPWLAWVAMVPLGLALIGARPRDGLLLFGLFAFLGWLGSVWWLFPLLRLFMGMDYRGAALALLLLGLLCLLSSLPYALFGFLYPHFQWLQRPCGALRTALAFTVIVFWFPYLFPGNLTHALYRYPVLIQSLDLGGMPLLFLLVHWVNFLMVAAILAFRRDRALPLRPAVGIVTLAVLILGYGQYRLNTLHEGKRQAGAGSIITVGSVQPDVPPTYAGQALYVPAEDRENDLSTVIALSEKLVRDHPAIDLVAWPELPFPLWYRDNGRLQQSITALVRTVQRPLLFPGEWNAGTASPGGVHYGTQFVAATGVLEHSNVKKRLLPFGEYVPFEKSLPSIRNWFPRVNNFVPEPHYVVFPLQGGRGIISAICYEVIFPDEMRRFVQKGGNVILNSVNDAWFGHTAASEIHLALALFRTVEFRVPLVRIANSGISAFVQPTGEIVPRSETALYRKAATAFELFVPQERSPYARWGDLFLYLLTAAWLIDTAVIFSQRRSNGDPL